MPNGETLVNVGRSNIVRWHTGSSPAKGGFGIFRHGAFSGAHGIWHPSTRARDVRFCGGEECKADTWHLERLGGPLCLMA